MADGEDGGLAVILEGGGIGGTGGTSAGGTGGDAGKQYVRLCPLRDTTSVYKGGRSLEPLVVMFILIIKGWW